LIVMIPMTLALLLDFSYLIQIATNKLKYRIITLFSGFAISFIVVFLVKGITLISYAYVIAGSMIIGQIVCVIFYIIRHINVNILRLAKELAIILCPPALLTGLSFFILHSINISVWTLVVVFLLFNVLLVGGYWLVASSDEKRMLIGSIKK